MRILIKNGRVIDPENKIDDVRDILIVDGKISDVAKNIQAKSDQVIDAKGKIVMPGIVDMHVHLREPGREDKETIASGTAAAIKGGVTSVLAMPNTNPAIDSAENIALLKTIIDKTAKCNVFISAAITEGRQGKKLTGIATFKKNGVAAITDDGSSVDDDALMLEAFKKAKEQKLLVICHSEDKQLSAKGVVNAGFTATRLGLRGISSESEYKRIARDIELAAKAKAAVHIAHVSCKESVELIAKAKKKSIAITAETAPHYFSLTDEATLSYDANMKMNPPLRGAEDVLAVKEGLKSGIINAIASDHAPHTENEKDIEFERAEFGVVGLETILAVSITELVDAGILGWADLAEKLCLNPAKILGLNKGTLSKGADADIIIVDPAKEWVVAENSLISKSKNSAFLGMRLKGVVEHTICRGAVWNS